MEFKDYYQTLGVPRDASQDEIKRAYRRLARKYHPDVSKEPDAEQRFKALGEAYEVLKDPEKRKAYDRFGSDWKAGQDFRPPPNWEQDFDFAGGDYTQTGDFSDFFETLFGGGHRRRRGGGFAMKGEDQVVRISVDLEDAFNGASRSITLKSTELDASGQPVVRPRTLNVRIPAGIKAGQRIRLAGQGSPGIGGAPAGDLYLEVAFRPHPYFRVDGRDVYLDLPVTPWEAALGATVTVPTLGGKVDLRIPPNSQTGRKLRLKGRGLPGQPSGDQFIELRMVTPQADSPAAKALYERMADELPMNPRSNLGV
ncbi:cytochrome C biogenesis protein [Alkalilimnicola ehrlichii]|uniref:Cytochrome C biogenesis protein n=1 Tax=Alkalilimnicola ehrlichii TaxID=351052 RepID=A0A3E0X0K9_9GAMM|nr:DnaJ C-terminal domain-containing protein [Alkalilimnicola ehrlichii]RFA30530.1 cytochrome C biogenesis protein [Alkalilimnicola ehrlichii]RFA38159.1 cytochrome C biogenesis protein [Alkalilimnicola ehrlichii]